MVNYIYYNTLKQVHISTEQEIDDQYFSFVLTYDNLKFHYNEYELITTLNYLRQCPHNRFLPSPSVMAINNLAAFFPASFNKLTFYPLLVQPELLNVFYPHLNDFYVFYDKSLNKYGISSSPRFAETKTHCIISIIPNLSQITSPRELRASLNFVKLGIAPDISLTKEQISHQISLFPELFTI